MKKIILSALIVLAVLIIAAVLAVGFFLDGAIKKGVEVIGPKLTKTDVKLDGASISFLSGAGKLRGLVVGNPEGYTSPTAISVGVASLAVAPGSLFSDKVIVKSINLKAPEITFETDLRRNNLSKLIANLQEATGGSSKERAKRDKANKKLQVNEFLITGGKIHFILTALGGKSATAPLPDIQLKDLGTGPEGITAAELTQQVLQAVIENATKLQNGELQNLSKLAGDLAKDPGKLGPQAEKVTKGISDILKKKK